jgi:hypothetical protein
MCGGGVPSGTNMAGEPSGTTRGMRSSTVSASTPACAASGTESADRYSSIPSPYPSRPTIRSRAGRSSARNTASNSPTCAIPSRIMKSTVLMSCCSTIERVISPISSNADRDGASCAGGFEHMPCADRCADGAAGARAGGAAAAGVLSSTAAGAGRGWARGGGGSPSPTAWVRTAADTPSTTCSIWSVPSEKNEAQRLAMCSASSASVSTARA